MGLEDAIRAGAGAPGDQGGDENRRTVCYHSWDKMKLYPIPKWAIEMVEGSERVMMIFLSVIAILVILILLFL